MRAFRRTLSLIIVALIAVVCGAALAQSPQSKDAREPTGSIAGRVTVDGKPARNVFVALFSIEDRQQRLTGRTTTDEEGNFKISRVAAGSYTVQTFTPALIAPGEGPWGETGKSIILSDGDEVEGLNIQLVRGGVITGRVTDADGNPLVEERVTLTRIDQRGGKNPFYWRGETMQTDDRGIYRIYGLPAGRYIVAAGVGQEEAVSAFMRGAKHPRTYHPDATDESLAKIVEVTQGSEQGDIDIVLGRRPKSFTASGRIVDTVTGRPVANAQYGVATRLSEGGSSSVIVSNRSDSNGEFRLEGLVPGRYAALARFEPPTDFYGESAPFEIVDRDVSGIVIKVHRGASVSGQVIIEGANEKQASSLISRLLINASVRSSEHLIGPSNQSRLEPDGSFSVTALPPGKVMFYIVRYPPGEGFQPKKIERDGIDQIEGVELKAGEHVSGLKVFIAYGSGRIRGQVKVEGGELPEGAEVFVSARNLDDTVQRGGGARADMRGNFIIERLTPGEYELSVNAHVRSTGQPVYVKRATQKVTVSNDEEAQVTVTLELIQRRDPRQ